MLETAGKVIEKRRGGVDCGDEVAGGRARPVVVQQASLGNIPYGRELRAHTQSQ